MAANGTGTNEKELKSGNISADGNIRPPWRHYIVQDQTSGLWKPIKEIAKFVMKPFMAAGTSSFALIIAGPRITTTSIQTSPPLCVGSITRSEKTEAYCADSTPMERPGYTA